MHEGGIKRFTEWVDGWERQAWSEAVREGLKKVNERGWSLVQLRGRRCASYNETRWKEFVCIEQILGFKGRTTLRGKKRRTIRYSSSDIVQTHYWEPCFSVAHIPGPFLLPTLHPKSTLFPHPMISNITRNKRRIPLFPDIPQRDVRNALYSITMHPALPSLVAIFRTLVVPRWIIALEEPPSVTGVALPVVQEGVLAELVNASL